MLIDHSNQSRLDTPHDQRRISALVAAYNEETTFGRVLDELLGLPDIDLAEVVVVDDGSRDRTASVVEGFAARDERVWLMRNCFGRRCLS